MPTWAEISFRSPQPHHRQQRPHSGVLLADRTYRSVLFETLRNHPHEFWSWQVPYNMAIKLGFLRLIFAKGRRANVFGLSVMILLFVVPYWHR